MHISEWSTDSDMETINLTLQILFKHSNIIKHFCLPGQGAEGNHPPGEHPGASLERQV